MTGVRQVRVDVVRVFVDEHNQHGNPLGVVRDTQAIEPTDMVALTASLGFSETILIPSSESAPVRIYNPVEELPFAGHPLVGMTWLRHSEGSTSPTVVCLAGPCDVAVTDDVAWVTAPTEWAPPWRSVQYASAAEIDALTGPPCGHDFVQTWAWLDESAGIVRARVFAPRVDIAEDEACGSASLLLAANQQRDLVIRHGRGSVVYAGPVTQGVARVGGRVAIDPSRMETVR